MKKHLGLIALALIVLLVVLNTGSKPQKNVDPVSPKDPEVLKDTTQTNMPNPASTYCEEKGGTLEIISNKDGSQFGMCKFEDFSCEEWVYFRNECNQDKDAEKIKQALIAKGLRLTDMKVVIHKHLGKYISGGVVPISEPAGGGYVFAVKENEEVKIVADGNGIITCVMLENYQDFPAYLISHCVDENGDLIAR